MMSSSDTIALIGVFISVGTAFSSLLIFSFKAGAMKSEFYRQLDGVRSLIDISSTKDKLQEVELAHQLKLLEVEFQNFVKTTEGWIDQNRSTSSQEIAQLVRKINSIEEFLENTSQFKRRK